MILEIDPFLHAFAHHDLVDHLHRRDQRALVFVRQRTPSLLVMPQHFVGRETHGEVIPQRPRLAEKLHMPRMENIVTAGNKNADHD